MCCTYVESVGENRGSERHIAHLDVGANVGLRTAKDRQLVVLAVANVECSEQRVEAARGRRQHVAQHHKVRGQPTQQLGHTSAAVRSAPFSAPRLELVAQRRTMMSMMRI